MTLGEKIYKLVSLIQEGKVTTYGVLARRAGIKNPRVVGQILHKNPDLKNIPCHRVVRSDGTLAEGYAFGGKKAQMKRLKKEGVYFKNGKIDLLKFVSRDL